MHTWNTKISRTHFTPRKHIDSHRFCFAFWLLWTPSTSVCAHLRALDKRQISKSAASLSQISVWIRIMVGRSHESRLRTSIVVHRRNSYVRGALLSTEFIAQTIKIPKIIWIYQCIAPVHTIIAKLLFDYSITSQKSSPNKYWKVPEQTVSGTVTDLAQDSNRESVMSSASSSFNSNEGY